MVDINHSGKYQPQWKTLRNASIYEEMLPSINRQIF